MGSIPFSALYGGIGDSVQGAELLKRIPDHLERDMVRIIGTCAFTESLLKGNDVKVSDTIRVKGAVARLVFELRTFWRLLRVRRMDAIFLRFRVLGIGPVIVAKLKGVPLVLQLDGFPSLEYSGTRLNDAVLRLAHHMDKAVINAADRIIVPIGTVRDGLERCYRITDTSNVVVVPNGADVETFGPMDRKACKRALDLPDGKIVLFFGAVERWQGIENLIEAFYRLREAHDDLHLVIVGSGTISRELRRHDGIIFRGLVPPSEVVRYINAADLTAATIPVDRIAFPMKIYESLACGVPIVVTGNTSTRGLDLLAPEFLLDDNRPGTIADRIEHIVYDADGRGMAMDARERIVSFFNWDCSARAFAEELDGACSQAVAEGSPLKHRIAAPSGTLITRKRPSPNESAKH